MSFVVFIGGLVVCLSIRYSCAKKIHFEFVLKVL